LSRRFGSFLAYEIVLHSIIKKLPKALAHLPIILLGAFEQIDAL